MGRRAAISGSPPTIAERQSLVIDGDDTLWENNVYFEQAIEDFIDFLAHSSLDRVGVRGVLDDIERLNAGLHGYGSSSFARNLRECYERLCERDLRPDDIEHVLRLGRRIAEQPMRLCPGVADTLPYLSRKHELLLFTKGNREEQSLKIDACGLSGHFRRTLIVAEKDEPAYRALIKEAGLWPDRTWMIGNSPRSDINPALRAGLHAVYIPHAQTWSLEREDLQPGAGRLLRLESFAQLRDHF